VGTKIASVLWRALCLLRSKKTKKGRISEPNTSGTIVCVPFLELIPGGKPAVTIPRPIILKMQMLALTTWF
jgi:hypothetical protein